MGENTALTPQEVASILKIAKNTVYELIKRGELNAYKVGNKVRIDTQDVEEYKNKGKNKSNMEVTKASFFNNLNNCNTSQNNNTLIISGQDSILDILSRYLELHPNGVHTLRSYIGSYNGLYALYHGHVHMATTHLWDSATNQYNVPFVKKMLPGISTTIIHIACRMQGFYVAKGNPKSIKSWEDFNRSDITIINREKGSGTRILLDEHLKKMKINSTTLNGYDKECLSHFAVASAVSRGDVDLGIGNEKTSLQVNEIDFIPIQKERYELVIKNEDINKPHFRAVLEILNSNEFKNELKGIGGYDISETGSIVSNI